MIKDLLKLLGIGFVLFIAGFLLKSVGVAELSALAANDNQHLTFTTTDGLVLHAWRSEAQTDTAAADHRPGLALLLPMMSKTHISYEPIIETLNRANYTTVAFDLRGHGLSTVRKGDTLQAGTMDKENFRLMPDDIDQFFSNFQSQNPEAYNYRDVVVIGASIGANTAGLLIDKPWVERVVMLSPGRDYYGLIPETTMIGGETPSEVPVYIATSVDDTYSAESSQWLFDNYSGPKVLKKYPGSQHGTNILKDVADADKELLSWLRPRK